MKIPMDGQICNQVVATETKIHTFSLDESELGGTCNTGFYINIEFSYIN